MYNKYLDTFIQVAELGSFAKAAEKLYISSTAVMKQINSLEDELGLTLTLRDGGGIKLTDSGKSIYNDAKNIIELSKKSIERARKLDTDKNYTITIGTSAICPCTPLIDLWYKINDAHPEFSIKIVPFDEKHADTLTTLQTNNTNIDFIMTPCDSKNWLKNLNFLKITDTKFVMGVPRNHPLAKNDIIDIETELNNEKVMIITHGDNPQSNFLREHIKKHCPNVEYKDAPFLYDINVFNECAENNYLLISLECWEKVHPSLKNIPITYDISAPYGILYSKKPSKSAIRFIELLKTVI